MGFGGLNMMKQYKSLGTTLKDGLISVWEFDETSGSIAYDSHINNNNGTIGANVSINNTGKINKSYSFNGTSITGFVTVPNTVTFVDKFTISAWINPNVLTWMNIHAKGRMFNFKVTPSASLQFIYPGIAEINSINITLQTSQWSFVTISYDYDLTSYNFKFYLNGVLKSTYSYKRLFTQYSDNYTIGGRTYYSGETFNGKIDQNSLWNRPLTQDEITLLYNSGNGLPFINW